MSKFIKEKLKVQTPHRSSAEAGTDKRNNVSFFDISLLEKGTYFSLVSCITFLERQITFFAKK